MMRVNWLTAVAVVLALVFGAAVPTAAPFSGEMKAGVAAVDITPTGAENVLDRLSAKAMVFTHGEQKAAVVVCDLIGVPTGATAEARKLAADKTGIPQTNIIISATHTHSGLQATDVAKRIA
jgi:hypothetical protein